MTDGDGAYLTHFTKPGKSLNDEDVKEDEAEDKELELEEEADSRVYDDEYKPEEEKDELSDLQKELEKKPAEVVARKLVSWIRERGVQKTLELLGGDSTTSSTGWRAGVIAWIEKLLEVSLVHLYDPHK